ncbi:MAG TPA: glycosyl transferase [Cyanobacteria bacterium UBA11372]|nr:glycosyl transferase [Cyanobacteria bacterium UBA11372]
MNKPLRIAFLLPNLKGGGLERVGLNLIKGMMGRNLKLDLVLTSAIGEFLSDVPSEIRTIDLKTPMGFRLKSAAESILPLKKYLQKEKPDIVVSHLYIYNIVAAIAKILAMSPTYLVLVEHASLYESRNRGRGTQVWLLPLLMRYLYPLAGSVIAVSQSLARELEADLKLKPNSIKTIYNPVINESLFLKAKEAVEHPWFKEGEPPVILGVGRLATQKDFPTLIRAFAMVRQVQPARLVILGDGPEKAKLAALIQELNLENDVALLGFTKNPYAYMARAGVFVLSSAWEGLPTVLIEAMAIGTPIVSTNCKNGPEEILDGGKYGELVSVGNSEAMAQSILGVLSGDRKQVDPDWLDQFTWKTAIQNYLNLLGIAQS